MIKRPQDRVAVITDGASGIGLAPDVRLPEEGALFVIADLDHTAGTAAATEVGGIFVPTDVTDKEDALCPGPANTPLLQELFAKDAERAQRRFVHIPMGRFAEASELAAAVAFLASDDSSFMTATTFLVDGGISAAYVTPL